MVAFRRMMLLGMLAGTLTCGRGSSSGPTPAGLQTPTGSGLTPSVTTPTPTPTPTPSPSPSPAPPPGNAAALGGSSLDGNSPWVTYLGRFDRVTVPGVARFAYAGSAVSATFVGSSLSIVMGEELPPGASGAFHNWFNVYLDGAQTIYQANGNANVFLVADSLPLTQHQLVISKRTDPSVGVLDLLSVQTSANGNFLTPPTSKLRRLEVIGASEVSGYGVDANTSSCGDFYYQAFNGDEAYLAIAADALSASAVNLGYAGKGITRNYAPQDNVKTLPYIYPRTIPDDPNAPLVDFATQPVDAVILDAGGADFTTGLGASPTAADFIQTYATFLQTLRVSYPQATIVCAMDTLYTDPFRTQLRGYIQAAMTQVGDAHTVYFEFPVYDASLGYGCNGHPDAVGCRDNGELLTTFLQQTLGW